MRMLDDRLWLTASKRCNSLKKQKQNYSKAGGELVKAFPCDNWNEEWDEKKERELCDEPNILH